MKIILKNRQGPTFTHLYVALAIVVVVQAAVTAILLSLR